MVFTKWEFDKARNQHYWVDNEDHCYIYEDGKRIPLPQDNIVSQAQQPDTTRQTSQAPAHHGEVSGGSSDWSVTAAFSNLSLDGSSQPVEPSMAWGTSGNTSATQSQTHPPVGCFREYAASYPAPSHGSYQPLSHNPAEGVPYHGLSPLSLTNHYSWNTPYGQYPYRPALSQQVSSIQSPFQSPLQSPENPSQLQPTNEQQLQQVARHVEKEPREEVIPGVRPHRKLLGSAGYVEEMDPNFSVRLPGYKFFKIGVVFRVLWPELEGDVDDNMTMVTTSRFPQENQSVKVRWFVVVREGHGCCTCLPIQTYGGRGVTGFKVKSHHAIVYTGPDAPQPLPSEHPSSQTELPMGDPIRVIGLKPWDNKMDLLSRVNFVKLYTIEHTVKVDPFGYVDLDDEWKLISQCVVHWRIAKLSALPPTAGHSYTGLFGSSHHQTSQSQHGAGHTSEADDEPGDKQKDQVSSYIFDNENNLSRADAAVDSTGNGKGKGAQGSRDGPELPSGYSQPGQYPLLGMRPVPEHVERERR